MKFIIYLSVLAVLLSLALAQPVAEENQEIKIEEGPADIEQAVAQFLRQEAEEKNGTPAVVSHSRQKRATCRCYRRSPKVIVCYCR